MSNGNGNGNVWLRSTHRSLYYGFTAYAVLSLFLGLNFIFLHPTFNPLNIPKGFMGVIFLSLGITMLVLLNQNRSMKLLRAVLSLTIAVMFFWAGALTIAYFELHQTSLQLPITYIGLAILGLPLVTEPYINPATDRNGFNGNGGVS